MVDLTQSILYKRARLVQAALTDGLVWINAMNNGEIKRDILNWIRQDQLFNQGIDGDGNVIGFYSQVTSFINPRKEFNTHYTLFDTGDFYRSMVVVVLKDAILINADSQKMEDQEWWRNEILELTDENIEKLREVYKEKAQDYVRNVLLGHR